MTIASADAGLVCDAGRLRLRIPAFAAQAGTIAVYEPQLVQSEVDVASAVGRVLATVAFPVAGTLQLFGEPVAARTYVELLRMRQRLGLVQGRGGLLSNRTLRDNIALPIATHGKLGVGAEAARVQELLAEFHLQSVGGLRPHEVDGTARFRACAARAVALEPAWLVVEGVGDFEASRGLSPTWRSLAGRATAGTCALAVCLSRPNGALTAALAELGAVVHACLAEPGGGAA